MFLLQALINKLSIYIFCWILFYCSFNFANTTLDELLNANIVEENESIRLHLGCGESHYDGYVNIDYPLQNHTVQRKSGADFFHDITELSFPINSISEIRNHHLFEHFSRAKALALLTAWHLWLEKDGLLFIETPDFKQSIEQLLSSRYSYKDKQVIIRHLFGSQEASWALHYDGWYDEKYESILNRLGFRINSIIPSHYKMISNITIHATKVKALSLTHLKQISKNILTESLVDNNPSELDMLEVWYLEYNEALAQLSIQ